MAVKYTEEQLNSVDKSFLIQLLLQQQEQLEAITKELHASNEKMQLLMEQAIQYVITIPQIINISQMLRDKHYHFSNSMVKVSLLNLTLRDLSLVKNLIVAL